MNLKNDKSVDDKIERAKTQFTILIDNKFETLKKEWIFKLNDMDKILLNRVEAVEKEIKEYQRKCKHKDQQIKLNEKNSARWTCDRCEARLRYPTPEELQSWHGSEKRN